MKKTKLVAGCVAVDIFAIIAIVQAVPRADTSTPIPLGEKVLPTLQTRSRRSSRKDGVAMAQ